MVLSGCVWSRCAVRGRRRRGASPESALKLNVAMNVAGRFVCLFFMDSCFHASSEFL